MTKSQTIAGDVAALLRARNPILWIVTREEARVERYLIEAAAAAKYATRTWDCAQGVCDIGEKVLNGTGGTDPVETINAISTIAKGDVARPTRYVWIMRDLAPWLQGPIGVGTVRSLRNLARLLPGVKPDQSQAVVILTPSRDVPAELANHATVIEWPLPDREEIAGMLDAAIASLPEDLRAGAAPNGRREAAIDAAIGLSGEEAQACYARSLVQLRRIDPTVIAQEKRRVIASSGVLEWYDPLPGGLESVGGLENVKEWLKARTLAYTPAARAYGLPMPKGMMLIGVPGCGKSLTAKAVATAWGIPLLRVDLGALKSKFVGESEGNLRKAFAVIAAIGRCVVWFDEIEKALAGSTQGAADGGVSSDALGSILSWMQERQGQAFVIATANDADALPPELLRKGRFDELFFVDLPTQDERVSVLLATLLAYPAAGGGAVKLGTLAQATEGFSGAELAAIVPEALFAAFADGQRKITTDDLMKSAESIVPLSQTAPEKIAKLREWSKGRARPASPTQIIAPAAIGAARQIELS